MDTPHFLTIVEQAAEYLRKELFRGTWSGTIPGVNRLAPELGVNGKTVELALRQLEKEGLLVGQGPGRRRKIVLPKNHAPPALRVAVLFYEKGDEAHDLLIRIQAKLVAAGHTLIHAPKNLTEIGGDTRRLTRMIKATRADAWVVVAGSKEVLQCFVEQQVPAFALFGGQSQLRIAGIGPNLEPAIVAATRRLIALGHRRIVLLDTQVTLSASQFAYVTTFCDEMAAQGIKVGNYNLPGWEGGFDGFYRRLESLFSHTPPTAVFLFSSEHYYAMAQFLLHRGLRVPQDVSLISMEKGSFFRRYQPSISYASWDDKRIVNRIGRWAKNISLGEEDTRQTRIDAEFIEGGTVGRVEC